MASVWRATGGSVGAQQIQAGGLGRSLTSWLDYNWNLEEPSGYKSGKQSLDDGHPSRSRARIAASGRLRPESGAPTSGVYLGFSIPIVRKGITSPPSGHHLGFPLYLWPCSLHARRSLPSGPFLNPSQAWLVGRTNFVKPLRVSSCSWILWSLRSWDIVIPASAHLPSTTVNVAEYTSMNNGVMAALERGLTDLIIVGDSRLATQQSMGVMASKKEALQLELARHTKLTDQLSSVRYLHVLRHYNAAADSLATEALESKMGRVSPRAPKWVRRVENQAEVEVSEGRIPDATDIDPAVVQAERRRRISTAQDEELRCVDLKALLRGELDSLTHRRAQNASKIAGSFVLSEDGLLYYQGLRRRRAEPGSADISLRLVVPTIMVDEVLHGCHNSIEGGHQGIVRTFHRVKAEFYWVGLYADVSKHVQTCEDCSTSKSKPQLRGYSPGNVTSEYPFQMASMDFVIPLPVTRRGITALLLFQDHFTGFVIAKAMSETGALEVAKAFEACRSRATLSYRPQANGQQERSVKTMIKTVRAYVEDPLQADWDDIAEKMVDAINNSRDTTRRETPFYLVHGWDAQSTLKSMTSTIKKDPANSADAAQWR
ncbi:unnamed protein product [Phytophthora fragariaefolia]|uniref:Unnamed protein product n=1 Tax=Phytophthora fragariaefolia TaxID=1490495 RepID=A0A9W7D7B8_9STRA|nr:unnamed protein product [Phytophthora fragariaefolia]